MFWLSANATPLRKVDVHWSGWAASESLNACASSPAEGRRSPACVQVLSAISQMSAVRVPKSKQKSVPGACLSPLGQCARYVDGGDPASSSAFFARSALVAWSALGPGPSVEALICVPVSELFATLTPVTSGASRS